MFKLFPAQDCADRDWFQETAVIYNNITQKRQWVFMGLFKIDS